MPRVLTADELLAMNSGHGWLEYKPEEDDGQEIPWKDYVMETVWIQPVHLTKDYLGEISTGNMMPNEWYGADWRIWNEEPTEELAKATVWCKEE